MTGWHLRVDTGISHAAGLEKNGRESRCRGQLHAPGGRQVDSRAAMDRSYPGLLTEGEKNLKNSTTVKLPSFVRDSPGHSENEDAKWRLPASPKIGW